MLSDFIVVYTPCVKKEDTKLLSITTQTLTVVSTEDSLVNLQQTHI